jgi:hypothetical protein
VAETYGPTDASDAIRAAISPGDSRTGATVVGDAATIPVSELGQVEAAFAGAADAYRAQGLVGLRPELRALDRLTGALTLVEVRWAYLDGAGAARKHSSYRYLLRRADGGRLGIQVVVDTTAPVTG